MFILTQDGNNIADVCLDELHIEYIDTIRLYVLSQRQDERFYILGKYSTYEIVKNILYKIFSTDSDKFIMPANINGDI